VPLPTTISDRRSTWTPRPPALSLFGRAGEIRRTCCNLYKKIERDHFFSRSDGTASASPGRAGISLEKKGARASATNGGPRPLLLDMLKWAADQFHQLPALDSPVAREPARPLPGASASLEPARDRSADSALGYAPDRGATGSCSGARPEARPFDGNYLERVRADPPGAWKGNGYLRSVFAIGSCSRSAITWGKPVGVRRAHPSRHLSFNSARAPKIL